MSEMTLLYGSSVLDIATVHVALLTVHLLVSTIQNILREPASVIVDCKAALRRL